MPKFLEKSEIDYKKWDDCVQHASQSIIYAESWYLDCVAPSWGGIVLEENGRYLFVFPVAYNRKAGVNYVYQPFFTQQLGYFSNDYSLSMFYDKIVSILQDKFRYVAYAFNTYNTEEFEFPEFVRQRVTYEIAPIGELLEVRKKYNSNRKRDIKKAVKAELRLESISDFETVLEVFRANRGLLVDDLKDADYQRLEELVEEASHLNRVVMFKIVDAEHSIHAVGLFLTDKHRMIYLFGAATQLGMTSGAMSFMLDRAIAKSHEARLIFDFEGSDFPNLSKFYSGFGGVKKNYPHYQFNRLPWYLKLWKK